MTEAITVQIGASPCEHPHADRCGGGCGSVSAMLSLVGRGIRDDSPRAVEVLTPARCAPAEAARPR